MNTQKNSISIFSTSVTEVNVPRSKYGNDFDNTVKILAEQS